MRQDDADEMQDAVGELLQIILERNAITPEDVVSVLFTNTPDLHCAFPAKAAREVGFTEVPLMCAQEIDVEGALERVVRVMLHVDIDRPRREITHVYIRGAEVLRPDTQA